MWKYQDGKIAIGPSCVFALAQTRKYFTKSRSRNDEGREAADPGNKYRITKIQCK